MRLAATLLATLLPLATLAQLSDNFADGDLTANPPWSGDAASFAVANRLLQSNGPAATGTIALATPNRLADNAEWTFWLRLDFAPSTANQARVYLMSDQPDLKGPLNGYFVRIGADGSDDGLDLWRQQGTTVTRLITGQPGTVATNPTVRVRVTRDAEGNWQLAADFTGGTNFVPQGSTFDNTVATTAFFGVACLYTTTNRQRFFFTDFGIRAVALSPAVQTIGYNEVIISEIMADPNPAIGLPAIEYIELYNRTSRPISLSRCRLSDDGGTGTLPDSVIGPGEYRLVGAVGSVAQLRGFGRTVGVANFSLNAAGETLTLRSPAGRVVFSVAYSDQWYGNNTKRQGGWSLEMIDLNYPCGEAGNWTASTAAAGGTPARANAVAASRPDLTPPQLRRVEMLTPTTARAVFDEKLDSLAARNATLGVNNGVAILTSQLASPGYKELLLTFAAPLRTQVSYRLTVNGLTDCAGNLMPANSSTTFVLPQPGDSADVVLTEVLFNPRAGGVDFVEVYNRSEKYITLRNWQLANVTDGTVANLRPLTPDNLVIAPRQYYALTADARALKGQYPKADEANFLAMTALPAYNVDAGAVVLLNDRRRLVDRFDYDENLHFALLDDRKGVSLERTNADSPANDPSGWRSAASSDDYATPGYRNSQARAPVNNPGGWTVEPRVFTPDEDGTLDFTILSYALDRPGQVASVQVYDARGRPVKTLAQNRTLGTTGEFRWDGTDDRNEKVRVGYYVFFVEVFDLTGDTQQFKQKVVVGARF